jgi:uncharacterized protein YndB with AHSA1/START domain
MTMKTREAVFAKDMKNKKLTVVRAFNAPLERVWNAWTKSEILDKWWAPKPYRVETKGQEFREGGFWLYCMVGPTGDRHYSIENYQKIVHEKMITNFCSFCDEEGKPKSDLPADTWKKVFNGLGDETEVHVEISFNEEAAMEAMLKMGFEAGFTAGLSNLDDYLAAL